ncbi:MAG TPA: GNAT family N-acetyltransferase [Candidatus Limnocylindrales bacterium]|nr:GNAT family N-acetyltransferase [Candidatus Limnocylindrales bacterium]
MVSDACLTVERDFAAAWWLLADATGHELHDDPDLRWFHTGLPDPYLNPVLATRLAPSEADAVLDRMGAELTDRGAPFTWWATPSSSPDDLAARLVRRGLVAEDPWPGMTLEIDAMKQPPPVSGLAIRRVTNDLELETYVRTFAPILSPSPAFTDLLAEASRRIGYEEEAAEVHFVGLLDGEPVATSSLITAGGAAGIYNVTTVEHARGRGIGAAMTAAAVEAGHRRGMTTAALQASTMGRSVYESLGFRHACDLVPYQFPRPTQEVPGG